MNAKQQQIRNLVRKLRKYPNKMSTPAPAAVQAICPGQSKPVTRQEYIRSAVERRRIIHGELVNKSPNLDITKFIEAFDAEFKEFCQGLKTERARLIEEAKNEYVPGEDVPVADAIEPTNVVFGNNMSIPILDETTDMDAPTAEELPMENVSSIESTEEPMKKVVDAWITSDKLASDPIADKPAEESTEKEPVKGSTPKFSGWGGLLGTGE